jgi:hypothetical protein
MKTDKSNTHFAGKSAFEHLKEARKKGSKVIAEIHGTEPSGSIIAFLDNGRNASMIIFIVWLFFYLNDIPYLQTFSYLIIFTIGLTLVCFGRSTLLGWSRLERLHRLIEEERWEIQHHREQEREELIEIYQTKGFSGELLDQVIETLMSDDNRLLEVMLIEELGLPLEAYEHPLKQGLFAAIGVFTACLFFIIGFCLQTNFGPLVASVCSLSCFSLFLAMNEQNEKIKSIIWNLAVFSLSSGCVYFLGKLMMKQ